MAAPIIADYKSIIIPMLSPNVVLDVFLSSFYKFQTSICYLWPVGLIDLSSYNSFLSKKKAECMDYFDYNKYSDETYCAIYHRLICVKV